MSVDRSMRNALAAILLVAALFVAMNQVVASAPLADWWLPLVLFVVGALLVFSPSLGRRPGEDEEAAPPMSSVHTYLVTAPAAPQLLTATASDGTAEAEVLPFDDTLPETESGDDDLTRINGIGKKSAEALKTAGIDTFQKLAATTEDTIRAAITDAGVRLVGDVDTWPQQAAYAERGDWDGLNKFVAEHRAASED